MLPPLLFVTTMRRRQRQALIGGRTLEDMSLAQPSRTIVVEPVQVPAKAPAPAEPPRRTEAPAEPAARP
jgi:hypothetical protein